jgi:anoctamin-8
LTAFVSHFLQTAQDVGHVIFSLFIVAWASLYLEAWRRCTVELSNQCGAFCVPPDCTESPRPLCRGVLEESPTTGKLEPKEAPVLSRRIFRYFVSFPIIGVCLMCSFLVMLLMLRVQIWFERKLPERGIIAWLDVIPKVLLSIVITISNELFFKLAVLLNDQGLLINFPSQLENF